MPRIVADAVGELRHGRGGDFDLPARLRQGEARALLAAWIGERQLEDCGGVHAEVAAAAAIGQTDADRERRRHRKRVRVRVRQADRARKPRVCDGTAGLCRRLEN
eukprot:COSAG03_NODE_2159_length_3065_cov_5.757586_4_plen_105_part_00